MSTYKGGVKNRRLRVIKRLEAQLQTGFKPGKTPVRGIDVTLDETDVKRITKEIATLKQRA